MGWEPVGIETATFSPRDKAAANAVIHKYAFYSFGCGFIPAPVVDVVAVLGFEVLMIQDLSHIYRFPFPGRLVTYKIVVSVLGSILPVYSAMQLQNLIKVIPGLGAAASTGLLAITNGASVYAVGKVFQRHFESGGVFLSSNNIILRRFFKERYLEGKQVLASRA
jgi:uncharacterized protein (DUF697 family)